MATRVFSIEVDHPQSKYIQEAVKVILEGGLVVFPTETVYGIAADSSNEKAIARMRDIKQRPADKPFALLIDRLERVSELSSFNDPKLFKVIAQFWPGPLTVIVPDKEGRNTIGLRMPNHNVALRMLQEAGCCFAAPSANISGKPAPTTCAEALQDLDGLVDLALDGGPVDIGQSSTILDFTQEKPTVIREGVLTQAELDRVMEKKQILFVCTGNSCRSVMAEYLMRDLLKDRDDVEVKSAGTAAFYATSASPEAISVLREQGIDASAHRAQPVTKDLLRQADLILAMTRSHRQQILDQAPEMEERIYLLREFAQMKKGDLINELDIPDPMGHSLDVYQSSMNVIKEAVRKVNDLI